MSQYGRHPQHYHHQSSVMPEKPTSWDMVESAAAINAAAASIVNSRYVGGGGFPNGGYPNLNDSGGNGGPSAAGGAGGYSDNSNGAMSGVGGMAIGQQQQQHQQSMQQQHWRAVRLPTAASAAYYSGQLPTTNSWMNHQQQRQMQQQQQLQQLAHPSLNILSANAPTFLNPLTSPTSPTVPSSQTTVWSTKLPQQNMLPLDVDDLSKHDLRQQQQQRNVDHHHRHLQQQQSPSYGGHFSSPTSFGVEMGGGSFNGVLPTASVESSTVSANAGTLTSPQQQQSPNYARHHSSSNMASTSMIGEIKTMPLYHSSSTTELDTLRAFASSASAKATVTEPFPTSSNKSMHGVPVSQSVPTSIPNPTKSPQFFEGQQLHSPRNNVFNNNNLLNRMNGDNNNGGSSMTNSSAFCRPNSTVNKQSPQTSPIASTGQPSGGTVVSTANNDLEIAKTMLSIRTCQTPTSSLENSALESSKSPNANCYQQISPADKSNLSSESPVNGISASSDNEEVIEPPNASATVENGHKEENDDDDMKRSENVEECHEIEEGEANMDACKSPNALSIVESMNVDMVEKEGEGINSPPSTPTSLVHRPESNSRLTPVHTPAHLSSSTTSKNRNSYAQISSDTLQPSKMLKENNSSPDSNLSMPSPMLSAMSFPSFAAASNLQIPLSFGGHTSASLVSGPQNTGAMGNVSLQNIQSMSSQQGNVYTCQICRFSSTSKFHFNSHMNTHTDHKCKYCDYTSRTVGRLKRHMNDFHTHSDRMETPPTNVNQESQDSCGNMSQPPSPDDSIALMDQQLESVVSSVAEHNQSGGIAKPVSSNKPKTYRCKQCHHVARSKNEFWDHQRSHIKNDRVLSCPKCSFVTEYKHHLEYHLRNHFGSKPFKCTKCNYTCVNKSMLNSHMKSHSNFYQYRCMDCTYATKYCHSLKLHLRKYSHTPATVMNPDGTAVENIVLDAFGNRRSSKTKKSDSNTPPSNNMMGQTTSSSTSLLPPMTSPSVVSGTSMVNPSFAPFIDLIKQQQELAAMVNMGISTWGAQLPRVPDVSIKNEPMAGSSSSGNNNEGYPPSQVLKCNFCNFHTSDGKDSLAAHMLKHIMENKELCRMYGFTDGTGTSGSTGSGSSTPGADRDYSMENSGQFCGTPVEHHRSSGSGGFFGGASGRNANSPMHHEISQDSNSPASTSGGKISGDEGALGSDHVNAHSGNNNRRKGKAFKLDKIALRLQGRVSPTQQDYNSTNDQVATDETVAAEKDLANGRIATSLVASGNQTVSNFKSSSGNVNSSRSSDISGVHNNMRSHKHQSHNVRLNRAESTSSLVGSTSNRQSLTNANGRETAHSATDYDLGGHTAQPISIDWSNAYVCNYCEIAFKDCIMHTMHMGYHCIQDPFKCNSCGQVNKDKLDMFLHIARAPHS